jgi:hypothetical protein
MKRLFMFYLGGITCFALLRAQSAYPEISLIPRWSHSGSLIAVSTRTNTACCLSEDDKYSFFDPRTGKPKASLPGTFLFLDGTFNEDGTTLFVAAADAPRVNGPRAPDGFDVVSNRWLYGAGQLCAYDVRSGLPLFSMDAPLRTWFTKVSLLNSREAASQLWGGIPKKT